MRRERYARRAPPGEPAVGWTIGHSLATELVSTALRSAIESRRPVGKELLHHRDRGSQYTSEAYQQKNLAAARLSVFKYIETFYNTERLHQTLGYKSPEKFETEYDPVIAA